MQSLLETLQPKNQASKEILERLRQTYQEKGFLSKRELKELNSLQTSLSKAA